MSNHKLMISKFALIMFGACAFGGMTTLAAAAVEKTVFDEHKLSLSGTDWFIRAAPPGDAPIKDPSAASTKSPGWTAATVPGNIQADLEAVHLLQPLWYGSGDPHLAEVAQKDWWYRKDFVVSKDFEGKRIKLIFDGVDYECEVWLNGVKLGHNAGMFRRFGFDVADVLKPGQTNRLALKIYRMPEEIVPYLICSDGRQS
jgi:beta-mannosidase